MNCEQIQNELPLYIDGGVTERETTVLDSHLAECALCREALDDYGMLRSEMRNLPSDALPAGLADSLKSELAANLIPDGPITLADSYGGSLREKIMHWMMPYSVGTAAATVFAFGFLFVMMSGLQSSLTVLETGGPEKDAVLLANSNADLDFPDLSLGDDYGTVAIASHPPKLNPSGALMSLTKSIVGGEMSNEEVVVVADVFGNGIARIAEVVEPPHNDSAMRELRKAFETDPESAPFMPSKLEGNNQRVRVVLKIQRVDVKRN